MKLNIKASSETGKVKSVSGNQSINIDFHIGNRIAYSAIFTEKGLFVWGDTQHEHLQGEKQKGEYRLTSCIECGQRMENTYICPTCKLEN